jgi:hypothetical protein
MTLRSSTSASRINVMGVVATPCKMGTSHTRRTSTCLGVLLRSARSNSYRQEYADNQNISFLPAIVSTSTRMHGEFLCLLFLQDHFLFFAWAIEAHFTGTMPSIYISDKFRFRRAAFFHFYQSVKSKVGLAYTVFAARHSIRV